MNHLVFFFQIQFVILYTQCDSYLNVSSSTTDICSFRCHIDQRSWSENRSKKITDKKRLICKEAYTT